MAQQRSTKDDFTFGSKLGSGSYGVVWLAVRKWDKKSYAVKELDLADMGRKEQEECIREVQVLAALDCPYIIKYYDSFLDKGRLYIVMEYATGGTLHTFINKYKGEIPEDSIWRLFIQVVVALRHMHSKKILHRDLKTLNIFLDENNNVKVGDFGVAKVLSTQTNFARTVVGTPYYLSPELCEDKPYNEKSDMWAAGVVLYELCTRRHPFDADNQGALILKILRGKFPPVTGYSPELQDLVKRCLTQAAQKRPSADRLIALQTIQDRAPQLGIQLPAVKVKPSASTTERTGSSESGSPATAAAKKGTGSKSSTVKKSAKPKSSTTGKAKAASKPKPTASQTIVSDLEDTNASTSAREQAQRDMASMFSSKDDDDEAGMVSGGVSQMSIVDGDGQAPTWRVVDGAKNAWGTGRRPTEESQEEEEAEEDDEEDEDGQSSAGRTAKLQDAVQQTKDSIQAMVGPEAMAKLYELLKQRSDGEQQISPDSSSIADLSRVVFKIIPYDKAEVLSLVYKLLYLEGQLDS